MSTALEIASATAPAGLRSEKLIRPQLPKDVLERPRLLAEVAGLPPKVLLLSAPVGFGKSTLLSLYSREAERSGRLVAWLTLDERDNDPARLLFYLRQAANPLGCAVPSEPPDIRPSQDLTLWVQDQTDHLLNHFAQLTQPFVLVLDDFETLQHPLALQAIARLAPLLRDGQCLAIGSRTTPPLPLATWRSRGQLLQLDASALSFRADELTDFIAGQPGPVLGTHEHALLYRYTNGWPGAARLVSMALRNTPEPTEWLNKLSGATSDIARYLLENLMSRLSPERRAFLLCSSVMDTLDGAICDHVLDRSGSAAELAELAHTHLLLVRLDGHEQRYRLHPMFRDFLQQQLQNSDPERLDTLRHRAATWLWKQDRHADAVPLALQCANLSLAAEIIDACALEFIRRGLLLTVEIWLDALPYDISRPHRRLQRARAYAMIGLHRQADALQALEDLRLDVDAPSRWEIDLQILVMYSWMDRRREVLTLRDTMLPHYQAQPPQDAFARCLFCNVMVYSLQFTGAREQARSWLTQAKQGIENHADSWPSSYTFCFDGMFELIEGRTAQALLRFQQACLKSTGVALASACAYHAQALYETDHLAQAKELLLPRLEEIRRSAPPDSVIMAYRTAARLAYAEDPDAGLHIALLQQLADLGDSRGLPRVKGAALLEQSRLALLDGQRDAAADYLRLGSAPELWASTQNMSLFAQEIDDVLIAQAHFEIAIDQGAHMVEALTQAVEQAHQHHRRWRKIRLQVLLAQALLQAGKSMLAAPALEDALLAARLAGCTHVVVDCPWRLPQLIDMLGQYTQRVPADTLAYYRQRSCLAAQRFHAATQTSAENSRLTTQEAAALTLVAQGHANKAIAAEMGLSIYTVQTHLRHAFFKLSARNRSQAVNRARERGWLR